MQFGSGSLEPVDKLTQASHAGGQQQVCLVLSFMPSSVPAHHMPLALVASMQNMLPRALGHGSTTAAVRCQHMPHHGMAVVCNPLRISACICLSWTTPCMCAPQATSTNAQLLDAILHVPAGRHSQWPPLPPA